MVGRYLNLIERGHCDIGAIPGQLVRNTGGRRYQGFLEAMEKANIKMRNEWIVQGDFEPEPSSQAMH